MKLCWNCTWWNCTLFYWGFILENRTKQEQWHTFLMINKSMTEIKATIIRQTKNDCKKDVRDDSLNSHIYHTYRHSVLNLCAGDNGVRDLAVWSSHGSSAAPDGWWRYYQTTWLTGRVDACWYGVADVNFPSSKMLEPALEYRWTSVFEVDPALSRHWDLVSGMGLLKSIPW